MPDRGRPRNRRGGGRPERSPRRPRRARRDGHVARLRRGLGATRVADAAKALGLSTTRRAALVATVVCALAFTLAVPLRTYLSQQADMAEQERLQRELRREVAELKRRREELDDPAQVEAEARRRLGYVMPGETPYVVQLPEQSADAARDPGTVPDGASGAWYEQLWGSVTRDE